MHVGELEGLERRKTPLSDHLHDVLSGWARDYQLTERGFTRLFETFETLGSLAFLTLKTTKEELTAAHGAAAERNFVWSPVGRAAWDSEHREPILAWLGEAEPRQSLLEAGFAKGDAQFLSLAAESLSRLMGRIAW